MKTLRLVPVLQINYVESIAYKMKKAHLQTGQSGLFYLDSTSYKDFAANRVCHICISKQANSLSSSRMGLT